MFYDIQLWQFNVSCPWISLYLRKLHRCKWSPQIQPAGCHRSSRTIYVFWPLYFYQLSQKTFNCNDIKITELEMIHTKNFSPAYVLIYKFITLWFLDRSRRMGALITPMTLAHPLHPIRNRSRNKRQNLSVGLVLGCASFRCWVSYGALFTISLIELFFMMIFIMTVVTIIRI